MDATLAKYKEAREARNKAKGQARFVAECFVRAAEILRRRVMDAADDRFPDVAVMIGADSGGWSATHNIQKGEHLSGEKLRDVLKAWRDADEAVRKIYESMSNEEREVVVAP